MQSIRALIWTSMSSAICKWYVGDNSITGARKCCGFGTGCSALFCGTWLVFSKHIGSIFFGSCIIAIVQLVRAVVAYIDYLTQDMQNKSAMLKVMFKCTQCCLGCLQKTIEFISYYGFIFVAMRGQNFCRACMSTFDFVITYAAQTAVNKTVQKLLKMLMGLSTPLFAAVITFYYLEQADGGKYKQEYNTIWGALIVFIIAYVITDGMCTVYDCAIDSIYLSAFKDMKENNPPKYMSNDLREGFGLDRAAAESSKMANNYKSRRERKQDQAGGGASKAQDVTLSAS